MLVLMTVQKSAWRIICSADGLGQPRRSKDSCGVLDVAHAPEQGSILRHNMALMQVYEPQLGLVRCFTVDQTEALCPP